MGLDTSLRISRHARLIQLLSFSIKPAVMYSITGLQGSCEAETSPCFIFYSSRMIPNVSTGTNKHASRNHSRCIHRKQKKIDLFPSLDDGFWKGTGSLLFLAKNFPFIPCICVKLVKPGNNPRPVLPVVMVENLIFGALEFHPKDNSPPSVHIAEERYQEVILLQLPQLLDPEIHRNSILWWSNVKSLIKFSGVESDSKHCWFW